MIHCVLLLVLIVTSLGVGQSPAQAMINLPPPPPPPNDWPIPCNPPYCTPQSLSQGNGGSEGGLLKVDFNSVTPEQFVTDVEGASSDPMDILQLVEDAITVWEGAFKEKSLPTMTIYSGWADFGALEKATSEAIALHICGAPYDPAGDPPSEKCAEADRHEATILFNSKALKVQEPEKAGNVKFFLDTNPFNSSAFGPLQGLGTRGDRVAQSAEFSDPYVVDLFTVALHEVGHALGYVEFNGVSPADIADGDIRGVLGPYVSYSTRKCPSATDIQSVVSVGSYVPDAPEYVLADLDPCGSMPLKRPEQPIS